MNIGNLPTLQTRVDNIVSKANISPGNGFSTGSFLNMNNPIFYVVIGFIAIVIILLFIRPRFITIKVEKEGDEKPEYKLSYKRASIAIFVLALVAGAIIFGLYFKNRKKNMLI